ncbi:uncharacterized protein LOC128395523 [Panonychus citri]|uniref:uncharacterized protein LOC128395523 n=1 Tax=Panonychus citri TaxID=50023 RepID=UPI002307E793|nr:uncharacterized protein LOC128395523 [Panonychus citri]
MDSYVDRSAIDDVIKVFKTYSKICEKKKKTNLLSVDDNNDKIYLQMSFKLPPANRTTYINNYRPLPHPYLNLIDPTICIIVMDRNHEGLPDRDYDLRITKEYYEKRLIEAGISKDLIKHRLFILPMRELLTEYRLPIMKRRLASSFNVFMADSRLVSNRFKLLPKFLGKKFWIEKKCFPIGISLKYKRKHLKNSFNKALGTCSLYITGHGPDSSVAFGLSRQSEKELADNLEFVCKSVYKTFGKAIQLLKIKSTKSLAIPFYADLNQPIEEVKNIIPRTVRLNANPVIDEHPFYDNAELIVYPTGKTAIKRPRNWTPESDEEEDEEFYRNPSSYGANQNGGFKRQFN